MVIEINQELCIGCGACTAICPSVFKMNDEGKAEVMKKDDKDCAKSGAESCPVQAIKVE